MRSLRLGSLGLALGLSAKSLLFALLLPTSCLQGLLTLLFPLLAEGGQALLFLALLLLCGGALCLLLLFLAPNLCKTLCRTGEHKPL